MTDKPVPPTVQIKKLGRGENYHKVNAYDYDRAWELISTGHTVPQIMAATGLTKPQLHWLMKEGDPANGMPSFASRILEHHAKIRQRAAKAADKVGDGAVEALDRAIHITSTTQKIVTLLLQEVGKDLATNAKLPEDQRKALHRVVPSRQVTETLKALKPYADFSEVARAFRQVFDSPFQRNDPLSGLPREARLDLSQDALVPATVSLLDAQREGPTNDPLDALLPEHRTWSDEEIDRYIQTGQRPERDYLPAGGMEIEDEDDEPASLVDTEAIDPE